MSGYSKTRVFLLIAMLGAAAFVLSGSDGFAQATQGADAGAAAGAAAPAGADAGAGAGAGATAGNGAEGTRQKESLVQLIFHNLDFVFFTIAALSVAGLTLIIQGFIK